MSAYVPRPGVSCRARRRPAPYRHDWMAQTRTGVAEDQLALVVLVDEPGVHSTLDRELKLTESGRVLLEVPTPAAHEVFLRPPEVEDVPRDKRHLRAHPRVVNHLDGKVHRVLPGHVPRVRATSAGVQSGWFREHELLYAVVSLGVVSVVDRERGHPRERAGDGDVVSLVARAPAPRCRRRYRHRRGPPRTCG
jgi:hypothetical protein